MIEFFPSRAVALSLFGFEIHWYGLLYLAGFLIAAWLLPRFQKYRAPALALSRDQWMELLSWSVLGVIIGGRLGYVFFYAPEVYFSDPLSILYVWKGGMAFHGGFIGVLIVLILWSRRRNVSLLAVADIAVIPVAIGLALGRLGNFINQELYGTVTTLPWGMEFSGAEGIRHPIQLYAIGKDLFIALACYAHLRLTEQKKHLLGCTAAAFLILYSIGRFLLEYLREQDYPLTNIVGVLLTRGQLLTIPLFFLGLGLCIRNRLKRRAATSGSPVSS